MKKISVLLIVLFLSGFAVGQSNNPVANITIEGDLEEDRTLTLDSSESENALLQRWYMEGSQISDSESVRVTLSGEGEVEIRLEVENSEGRTDSTTEILELPSDNPLDDIRVQVSLGLVAVVLLGLAVINRET